MRLDKVLDGVRGLASEGLAEDWDKVGLQVGDPGWAVRRGMLCVDLTEAVLAEAVRKRVGLVVAYHPLVFAPLSGVTALEAKQRVVLRAIENRVAVYSPHTALDAAKGGVNDWLCDGLGAGRRWAIRAAGGGCESELYKVVVFVPVGAVDRVRAAMAEAGAGVIGDYTQCSFRVEGVGTFRGGSGADPAVGRRGRLERVEELRVEMVCRGDRVGAAVAAVRGVHPYEEPAIDVYRLAGGVGELGGSGEGGERGGRGEVGQGRVLELERAATVSELIKRVKGHLGVKYLKVGKVAGGKRIRRVGVCAGAGGSLLAEAGEVDAFVTGEMRHHDVLAAVGRGVTVVLAGHTQTERGYLKVYRRGLMGAVGGGVDWVVSRADRAPMVVV